VNRIVKLRVSEVKSKVCKDSKYTGSISYLGVSLGYLMACIKNQRLFYCVCFCL